MTECEAQQPDADGSDAGFVGEGVDPETYTKSKNYVYRLLAMRDYARAEIAAKLAGRDVPPELVTDLLDKFEDAGLIDDARFAESYVRAKRAGRGLAGKALAHELSAKGVSAEIIESAVGEIDPAVEEETAHELVVRKAASSRGLDRQKRVRRLVSMLGRKGYAPGVAFRVVNTVLEDEELDSEDAG